MCMCGATKAKRLQSTGNEAAREKREDGRSRDAAHPRASHPQTPLLDGAHKSHQEQRHPPCIRVSSKINSHTHVHVCVYIKYYANEARPCNEFISVRILSWQKQIMSVSGEFICVYALVFPGFFLL